MPKATDLLEEIAALKAMLIAADARDQRKDERIARLEKLIAAFKQAAFGRRSEKSDSDQFELALEDLETAMAVIHAEEDAEDRATKGPVKPRAANRGSLPKHLPHNEEIIEPGGLTCACSGSLHCIGEDVSERLDIVPAQFRVIVTRRPKYACRSCTDCVAQTPAPARLIPGGMPTEATVAHVMVSKYDDHLPLYRQAQIYSRQGVDLDRSTLADWVGRADFELRPVHEALMADLKRSTINASWTRDAPRSSIRGHGRRRPDTSGRWPATTDLGRTSPPGVVFTCAPGCGGQYAERILHGFDGILQVDGYAGYNSLIAADIIGPGIHLAYCWAHARRKLIEITRTGAVPIDEEGVALIRDLYATEAEIRGSDPVTRLAVWQDLSAPIIARIDDWLAHLRARASAKSPLGEALAYIAMNRKNALFAGHDAGAENWAVIASLTETCKMNSIDPDAWLSAMLTAIVQGHKQSQIHDLLPWNYAITV
ncbi:IS66 family transposase [Amaricoccus sp.]|uniref:IS66 family transposase n=1 Tax=Amaricoccus sp. TaxID=1872485 RepID=UPI002C875621|nr:IS66 family transposase [Amaricoccus sp.]HMQ95310.1 IS66 family transposase [Amaricoccus sp.]